MSLVYELENRGVRSHVVGLGDHVSGGEVRFDGNKQPSSVYFNPDTHILVHEECGKKLLAWKDVKLVKKSNRKE